tara:strand:- start:149 stop:730 length:582 start_codon:yes stop_codon:yes gene_type:complete
LLDIILASNSQRRKDLLKKINLKFKVIVSNFDESSIPEDNINPQNYCKTLAFKKAEIVSKKYKDSLIIGADTIVYFDNKIIGKPKDKKQAQNHLRKLSDNVHYVYTGVSVLNDNLNLNLNLIDKTKVTFNKLSTNEINYYIDNYKPYDKAGAYGIQDWSSVFVKKIDGCFYNVVGFPLPKFYKLLNKLKLKKD